MWEAPTLRPSQREVRAIWGPHLQLASEVGAVPPACACGPAASDAHAGGHREVVLEKTPCMWCQQEKPLMQPEGDLLLRGRS